MLLKGTSLSGGKSKRGRVSHDFYATPKSSVESLLNSLKLDFKNKEVLEPCVGMGHIAETLKCDNITGVDIVDRGWKGTIVGDFLTMDFKEKKFDYIITNPPFKLAQEFIEKSLSLLKENGKVCMFLKIQFLEGVKRKEFFKKYPPKYIYVFSARQSPLRNGFEFDENGKKWSSTMCFAWFVWEHNYTGDSIVKWI